jgi:hypothetical protein
MSFYDSASLAFLPSGGAGKDGKAYSIKPVPEYGNELVTNGGFDTDSDWTKTNATISGGVATITSTGYAYAAVVQTNVLTIGKTYKATFDINSIVGGLRVATSQVITNSGIASVTFTATNTYLDIRRDSSFATTTAVIDNVSVKEVIVDGDFTFSRGSNLTATRVDSNGLIEKGRENLLKQSNQFDTTWTTSAVSLTSGQSGYDGTNNAWLLTKTTIFSNIKQSLNQSNVCTFSVYAKANTYTWLLLHIEDSAGDAVVSFDLDPNTIGNRIGSQIQNIYASIESVGNGWYRCSITALKNATEFRIYPNESNGYSGAAGSIYIQDAQLEIGLVATEYIESGATTGKAGLLEDSPRFDYSGGASCPSLLLEPSRTNLVDYSEYFANWNSYEETSNTTTAPDGSVIKFLDFEDKRMFPTYNVNNATIYTSSIYLKANKTADIKIRNVAAQDSTIEVTTEWQRFDLTATSIATTTNTLLLDARFSQGMGASGLEVALWGAQLEEGSYPTSYIPNHSGGSETRGADLCNGAGDASTFNDSEGVLYAEFEALAEDSDSKRITISDGTLANRITISIANDIISGFINVNNSTQYTFYESGISVTDNTKIALKYKANDFSIWINGSEYDVSTSGNTFAIDVLNELSFDNSSGANLFYGNVKQVLVFPTALSNTDCEILTGTSYESFSAMATALNYTTYE